MNTHALAYTAVLMELLLLAYIAVALSYLVINSSITVVNVIKCKCCNNKHPAGSPSPTGIAFIIEGEKVDAMNLKVNDTLPISIVAEDKFGNPTGSLDSVPAWSVTDATLGAIQASVDGLSAVFTPSGKLGSCQIQVLGSAQGKQISGNLDLVLIAGDTTQIEIKAGTPVAV